MLEFLGLVFVGIVIYLFVTADDLDFTFKIDDRKVVDYHKHTEDEKKEDKE